MKAFRGITAAALFAALALFAPLAPAQDDDGGNAPLTEVMLLKLADGSSLWGRITAHDGERVSFQRIENGGVVRLPWKQLEPRQSSELLEAFGYVDHSGEELTVEVDRLVLDDGTEVIGRIVSRTDNEIYVKTADRLVPVPKKRISGAVTSVVVPALDVFTREELYRAEAEKLDTTSAKSEFDLGKYCERIFDFTHAVEHYKAAFALDPSVNSGLKQLIPRVEEKATNQVQLDYLYQVDSMRARGQFDAALKALDLFAQKWPDSSLRSEAERKKKQVEKFRLQAMRELVVGQMYKWAERLTLQQARLETGGTLEAGLTYASEKLKDELLSAVTKDLQRTIGPSVKPEEVKKLWDERKRGRFQRASYGQGTWLLGEAAALKEYGKDKAKPEDAAPKTGAEADRAKLEEKIKRYLDNQRIVAKKQAAAGPKEGEESEQEAFWRTWTSFYRGRWLLAYYVENGGDMKIVGEELTNCPDCGGTGTREMVNTGSARSNPQGQQPGQGSNSAGLVVVDCPTCHRVGRIRLVKYW